MTRSRFPAIVLAATVPALLLPIAATVALTLIYAGDTDLHPLVVGVFSVVLFFSMITNTTIAFARWRARPGLRLRGWAISQAVLLVLVVGWALALIYAGREYLVIEPLLALAIAATSVVVLIFACLPQPASSASQSSAGASPTQPGR